MRHNATLSLLSTTSLYILSLPNIRALLLCLTDVRMTWPRLVNRRVLPRDSDLSMETGSFQLNFQFLNGTKKINYGSQVDARNRHYGYQY